MSIFASPSRSCYAWSFYAKYKSEFIKPGLNSVVVWFTNCLKHKQPFSLVLCSHNGVLSLKARSFILSFLTFAKKVFMYLNKFDVQTSEEYLNSCLVNEH